MIRLVLPESPEIFYPKLREYCEKQIETEAKCFQHEYRPRQCLVIVREPGEESRMEVREKSEYGKLCSKCGKYKPEGSDVD